MRRRMQLRFTILAVVGALLSIAIASSASAAVPRSFYGIVPQTPLSRDRHRPHGSGQRRDAADHRQLVGRRPQPRRRRLQLGEHRYDRRRRGAQRDHDPALPLRHPHLGRHRVSTGGAAARPSVRSSPRARPRRSMRGRCSCATPSPATGRTARSGPPTRTCRRYAITAWQIWNEQNSTSFYLPRPNVGKAYAKLLQAANAADQERPIGGRRGRPRRDGRSVARLDARP